MKISSCNVGNAIFMCSAYEIEFCKDDGTLVSHGRSECELDAVTASKGETNATNCRNTCWALHSVYGSLHIERRLERGLDSRSKRCVRSEMSMESERLPLVASEAREVRVVQLQSLALSSNRSAHPLLETVHVSVVNRI